MKKRSKFFTILIAAIMVLAFAVPTMAADITMSKAQEDHDYEAYQIFAGTVETNGEISITGWGDGINDGAAFLTALKADATIGTMFSNPSATPAVDIKTAESAAKVVSAMNHDQLVAFARVAAANKKAANKKTAVQEPKGTYKWTGLADGYWMVLDETTQINDKNDFLSANILKVAGKDVTIEAKGSNSTSDKGVTDSETAPTTFIEVNNVQANIGDKVYYTLKGTTADKLNHFDQYKWTFEDTLPIGITFYQIEAVYAGTHTQQGNSYEVIPKEKWSEYTVTVTEPTKKATDGQAAGTENAPTEGGGSLSVEYVIRTPLKADGTRVIDHAPDTGAAMDLLVVYSAVVNQNATQGGTYDATTNTMHAKFTNDPNGDGEGKTPDEEAVVYNVTLDLDKVSNSDTSKKLAGAEFILHRMKDDKAQFAVIADQKIVKWETDRSKATKLTTGPEGGTYQSIVIKGLEGGSYVLYETKAPEGYNQPAEWNSFAIPFTITITGKDVSVAGLSDLSITIGSNVTGVAGAEATDAKVSGTDNNTGNGSISLGQVDATVKNSNKLTLPSTGGMGTTIFTVAGIALIVGAAVLLISRRRASGNH